MRKFAAGAVLGIALSWTAASVYVAKKLGLFDV